MTNNERQTHSYVGEVTVGEQGLRSCSDDIDPPLASSGQHQAAASHQAHPAISDTQLKIIMQNARSASINKQVEYIQGNSPPSLYNWIKN